MPLHQDNGGQQKDEFTVYFKYVEPPFT